MKPMKKFFMFFIRLMSSCQKFSEPGLEPSPATFLR